ncbi:MAG: methyl-accepting chemotaxis protein [Betaproteobacteria bacterium]
MSTVLPKGSQTSVPHPEQGYYSDGSAWQIDIKNHTGPSFGEKKATYSDGHASSKWDISSVISVPLLGRRTLGQHQSILAGVFGAALIALAVLLYMTLNESYASAYHLRSTGQALLQSQRLAKSATQALVGNEKAFPDLAETMDLLVKSVDALKFGDQAAKVAPLGPEYQVVVEKLVELTERSESNTNTIGGQQKTLLQIGTALPLVNRRSEELLDLTKNISALKQQQTASPAEISAIGELSTLTQRIGKSSNEFMTTMGVSAEAVFLLGKDLNSFRDISAGLLDGSPELRINPTKDKVTRDQLLALIEMYEEMRTQASALLDNLQGLAAAREAQKSLVEDSESLRNQLEGLQVGLAERSKVSAAIWFARILTASLAVLAAIGFIYVQLTDSRLRQAAAEDRRRGAEELQVEAQRKERDLQRMNDANQAAILRLMNELQTVAEGDLTKEATVSEDITGAIADSVNYTVEELRTLVMNVQGTVDRVAKTTSNVDTASAALLVKSNQQLIEIQSTGQSVVEMASRINDVAGQAQESAVVARQSLQAAQSGLSAVQNTIDGMNMLRDHIQETSKRIKRLGESSQEIGEITELISDITEQTNVLALNAAIQAASAGEAGRGFSVVAEEVQRLAERSATATQQIASLVKAIQTDTNNAMSAMERSAQGVVEGAKLSDAAGAALSEIDRVSRRVADRIEQISSAASTEATLADEVAQNIQKIFVVTEQTGDGTRATAGQVRELSRMAQELRNSVSRFKIA